MRLFNNFRFQFILNSYFSAQFEISANLFYDYLEEYGYTPKQDYLYMAVLYIATDKKLQPTILLKNADKKSSSLFYKEVARIEKLQKRKFKKKEYTPQDREASMVSEGFL